MHIIKGDLIINQLGLSKEDMTLIENNVNVIINCAASVDFNAKLLDALTINVIGVLQLY